ncbi:hypothetical protein [Burkholderia stabilis]|uniref:hypothetical protein n=1 Tax=Burkholderia stabilis TaxID=95485 RepID=UPI001F4ABDC8|nr:hypothetical protein [Burkholderia stabilis]
MIGVRAVRIGQGYMKACDGRMNAGRRRNVPDAHPVPFIRPISGASMRADPSGVCSLDNS